MDGDLLGCKLTYVIRIKLQLFRWMMRQLMAELFIVATKADVPLIKILQQNNVDGDQLTEDELVMYNFAVVSSGSSRPIVYSKKMLLEFKGNVDAVKRHIIRHVETEYERLEETWTLGENQCDDVWTIEAMDILDQEADEDEAFRQAHPTAERLPSHGANKELIEKEQRYRAVLQQARESDELVRQKWEEWEEEMID